ncbi:autotransporter strand-loop-strand O-heptosyltransferase [Pandoraea sputorum]|uniref:Glycosyltransferase tibC n=1 Tax=Pandoraea sputorum TaxID=93222 RepID=A0A239SQK7_9BURK|nr:autotransporter strand-loop-strand O-heptosyltransferase [Pandoraea sputorum]APD12578.1 autotransporter strand-loop-strand O-heptosyltransferase [Pandoraea sputorum]SNU87761.1 Glycosyltransferase tibC [Pandoraea sputorum]VVE48739.1 autotransporter strand-loop-strand O-heptosyltransferase [Pandoraea sputorum]
MNDAVSLPPQNTTTSDAPASAGTPPVTPPVTPPITPFVASPHQIFLAPALLPTQVGPAGLRFDFNDGARVVIPDFGQPLPWRVRISDLRDESTLTEVSLSSGVVRSPAKYYVPYGITIWLNDVVVFEHRFDLRDQDVLIQIPLAALGDVLGWIPYALRFKDVHGCRLACVVTPAVAALFRDAHPDVEFVEQEKVERRKYYATYNIGLFFDDKEFVQQPRDFRETGLHRTAAHILGVDETEARAKTALPDVSRPMAEPYVCIAVQSTAQCKYWNHPGGWDAVVAGLRERGFQVVCVDQKPRYGKNDFWQSIPVGAIDATGDLPLTERARWLTHASAFIGLSSGLSWLAWTMDTPTVLISGFTLPHNEFATPYRVINPDVCTGCWHDPAIRYNHDDFHFCPRHKGTERAFECTTSITPEAVLSAVDRVPGMRRTPDASCS